MFNRLKSLLYIALLFAAWAPRGEAYTANKVWFEFREGPIYRVYVNYTVPELKEFRESYVDFRTKKKAEAFYFDLIKGADFFPNKPESNQFEKPRLVPSPW